MKIERKTEILQFYLIILSKLLEDGCLVRAQHAKQKLCNERNERRDDVCKSLVRREGLRVGTLGRGLKVCDVLQVYISIYIYIKRVLLRERYSRRLFRCFVEITTLKLDIVLDQSRILILVTVFININSRSGFEII